MSDLIKAIGCVGEIGGSDYSSFALPLRFSDETGETVMLTPPRILATEVTSHSHF